MLLLGVPPFHGSDERATLQSVRRGKWKFHDSLFESVSTEARNFITACLDRSLSSRPSADVAMTHEWFRTFKVTEDSTPLLTITSDNDNDNDA